MFWFWIHIWASSNPKIRVWEIVAVGGTCTQPTGVCWAPQSFVFARVQMLWWLEMVRWHKVLKSSNLMCEKFADLGQMSLVALQVCWLLPLYLSNIFGTVFLNWKNLYLDCSQISHLAMIDFPGMANNQDFSRTTGRGIVIVKLVTWPHVRSHQLWTECACPTCTISAWASVEGGYVYDEQWNGQKALLTVVKWKWLMGSAGFCRCNCGFLHSFWKAGDQAWGAFWYLASFLSGFSILSSSALISCHLKV